MRNIKYRGLSYDKKKWFYGLPTYLNEQNCDEGIIDGIRISWEQNAHIIPETLGRFTGKIAILLHICSHLIRS